MGRGDRRATASAERRKRTARPGRACRAVMSPPIRSQSSLVMVSPRPSPGIASLPVRAPRLNGSKMRSQGPPRQSPGPVSSTVSVAICVAIELWCRAHPWPCRGELGRVRQQVDQHLAAAGASSVRTTSAAPSRHPAVETSRPLAFAWSRNMSARLVEECRRTAHFPTLDLQPAGLDLGHVEKTVDEPRQVLGRAPDDLHAVQPGKADRPHPPDRAVERSRARR